MSEDYAKEPTKPRRRDDEDDDLRRRRRDDDDDDYGIRRRDGNLADRGSRFVAALIDGLLMMICAIPGLIIVFTSLASADPMSLIGNPFAMLQIAFVGTLVEYLGVLGYQGAMAYMISQSGQTIGKRMMGIRIVLYENGKLPGIVNGWVLRWLVPFAIGFVPIVGGLFGLIDVLFIFGEEKRCIHDLIASTKVVMAEPLDSERDYRDEER